MIIKKILSACMAMTIICGAVTASPLSVRNYSLTASAEVDWKGDEYTEGTYESLIYWKYADYVKITACDESAEGELVIPSEIEGLPVTTIAAYAFEGCSGLTLVTIPDSVTDIGAFAFYNCSGLTSVTIPDGVTCIYKYTFAQCKSLKSIRIPDSVTSIREWTFYNCQNLESITIPHNVTSIDDLAFYKCTSLASITIPDSVASIGGGVFWDTPWLESRKSENPLVIINGILIDGVICSGDVVIPDSVISIAEGAFYGCTELTGITIPDSVTSIGNYAFSDCCLTSVSIPAGVANIGKGAFRYCPDLTSVTIKNPDCKINNNSETISNGYVGDHDAYYTGVICGYDNSTAQDYAEKYGCKFESLGGAPEYKLGDTNDDGAVDAGDASVILALYAKLSTSSYAIPTEKEKAVCDVNEDGSIDAADASIVLSYYAYVSTSGGMLSLEEFMSSK